MVTITVSATAMGGDTGPPSEVDGFGSLDHADTRDLVAAAARNPATRWCLTVLNPDGTAAAHACAAGPRPGATWTIPTPTTAAGGHARATWRRYAVTIIDAKPPPPSTPYSRSSASPRWRWPGTHATGGPFHGEAIAAAGAVVAMLGTVAAFDHRRQLTITS